MGPRLLIVTGDSASSIDDLPPGVRHLIDNAAEIHVIAPMLPSRLDWWASATDQVRQEADERLQAVIGQIDGAEVRGEVGADDPIQAFDDAFREFAPDHVLVGLRAAERAGWQERGLVDRLLERFSVPLTVFEVAR